MTDLAGKLLKKLSWKKNQIIKDWEAIENLIRTWSFCPFCTLSNFTRNVLVELPIRQF
jgi:hypothetical protein